MVQRASHKLGEHDPVAILFYAHEFFYDREKKRDAFATDHDRHQKDELFFHEPLHFS